jgi:AraC-like DNA-binding protein
MPMDYAHGLRLEAAKRLIDGGGAIDDVAQQVGYEDSAFFHRLFRREVGLSPAAYRRKFNVPFDDPGRRGMRSSLSSLPSDLRA